MTTNRLAKSDNVFLNLLTAADYASLARENGDGKKAQAWQRVAEERGEERLPDHISVKIIEGVKRYVARHP